MFMLVSNCAPPGNKINQATVLTGEFSQESIKLLAISKNLNKESGNRINVVS